MAVVLAVMFVLLMQAGPGVHHEILQEFLVITASWFLKVVLCIGFLHIQVKISLLE